MNNLFYYSDLFRGVLSIVDFYITKKGAAMFDEIRVLTHSSIRIAGKEILYFDPYNVNEAAHDADIIFVTHEHFDHFSPEDIAKLKNDMTILICPASMKDRLEESGIDWEHTELVEPGDELEVDDIKICAIASYNVGKQFHPKENAWVGYLVTMNDTTYYVAGDTDINDDIKKIKCDAAMLPCGGTYTMTDKEAAELALIIEPKLAIPTHYGSVAGDADCGKRFADAVKAGNPNIEVSVRMEY